MAKTLGVFRNPKGLGEKKSEAAPFALKGTASDGPGIVKASARGPGHDNLSGSHLTDRTRGATNASPVAGVSGIPPGHPHYTTILLR